MMKVKGYRILVKPDGVKTTTDWGYQLVLDERLEASGQQFGIVVDIGPTCWTDRSGAPLERWCEVGDKILYSKHSGRFVYDPENDDEEYLVIQDTDVIAVVEKDEHE